MIVVIAIVVVDLWLHGCDISWIRTADHGNAINQYTKEGGGGKPCATFSCLLPRLIKVGIHRKNTMLSVARMIIYFGMQQ